MILKKKKKFSIVRRNYTAGHDVHTTNEIIPTNIDAYKKQNKMQIKRKKYPYIETLIVSKVDRP